MGLKALVSRYPLSSWFILADSDCFLFPKRIADSLLPQYDSIIPQAIGLHFVRHEKNEMRTALLGGPGTIISLAGIQKMNLSMCLEYQKTKLEWNRRGSDWRLGLCFEAANVTLVHQPFLQMLNHKNTCGIHGPPHCTAFYEKYQTKTTCPYSLHYMSPIEMHYVFRNISHIDCKPG